jgi:PAS domain S-box-containing protein
MTPSADPLSILYVDDEPHLLDLGKIFLEKSGSFRIDTARSAAEAIPKINGRVYDGIISDYQMPEMDGISFLKYVRSNHGTLPFILFTGRGREEVVIEALNSGADFYVQKGGDAKAQFAELAHKITQAVQKQQAEWALKKQNDELNAAYEELTAMEEEVRSNLDDLILSQQKLLESEARLHAVVHGSPIPQFVIDKNHRVIHWNEAIENYTGIRAQDIIGTSGHWRAFYHEERPCLADLIVDEMPEKIPVYYGEKMCKSRLVETGYEVTDFFADLGGGGKWLDFTAAAIRNAQGRIIGAVETLEDITERRLAEDELKNTHKKLHILASLTRHDVLNQAAHLTRGLTEAQRICRQPEVSALIRQTEHTAANIIEQITFTRDYQDIGIQAPRWHRVKAAITDAVAPLFLGDVTLEVDVGDLEIYADPLIKKVFYNLVENALRHGGDLSRIRYSAVPETSQGTCIVCQDDGRGIPGSVKEMIFCQQYYQNTGVGLYLSREILAMTGISIAETGTEGQGARFEIHVPDTACRLAEVRDVPGDG